MKRPGTRLPILILLSALVIALALTQGSCRGGGNKLKPTLTDDGRIVVTLWHSMAQTLEPALKRIVDEFNESQDKYEVRAVFQGTYTESLNKLIATRDPANMPTFIQLDDTATQIMVDSGVVTPMQDFIDDDAYDLADFEPKALSYYRIDDKLYSMPFNLAGPILYYDREAFRQAGLDPDHPPATLDEVRQDSERILQKDASGKTTRYGIALTISPWVFEQMLAKQDALYVNNDNGRTGRATEAVFDSEQGKAIIEWWDQMVDDGLAIDKGTQGLDAMLELGNRHVAMAIESTAALRAAVSLAVLSGEDPSQLGTAFLPAPAGGGGIILGGASMWIMNERPDEEQRGAWEFIKFAVSPEQQAQWHSDTGYFPVRVSAYELPPAVKAREDFPQFETAVEQLHQSPDTPATRGALVGRFSEVRQQITEAFQEVLSTDADPGATLEQAAADATRVIEDYNRTVGD